MIKKGLLFGIIAGIIDVSPMLLQKLPWSANLSAFSLWVVVGVLIATTEIKMNKILKGILISFMVLLPCAILIGSQELVTLIPISIMTLILGSGLGYFLRKK